MKYISNNSQRNQSKIDQIYCTNNSKEMKIRRPLGGLLGPLGASWTLVGNLLGASWGPLGSCRKILWAETRFSLDFSKQLKVRGSHVGTFEIEKSTFWGVPRDFEDRIDFGSNIGPNLNRFVKPWKYEKLSSRLGESSILKISRVARYTPKNNGFGTPSWKLFGTNLERPMRKITHTITYTFL